MKKIFADFGGDDTLIFVDPVMADHGKLYPAFDEAYAKHNASLCGAADIIVPNLTEACFMTDTEYREDYDEAYIKDLLAKLAALGSKVVVLTGIAFGAGKNGVYGLDTVSGEYFATKTTTSTPPTTAPATFSPACPLAASCAVSPMPMPSPSPPTTPPTPPARP